MSMSRPSKWAIIGGSGIHTIIAACVGTYALFWPGPPRRTQRRSPPHGALPGPKREGLRWTQVPVKHHVYVNTTLVVVRPTAAVDSAQHAQVIN